MLCFRLSKSTPEIFDHVRSIIIQTLEQEFDLRTAHAEKLFEEVLSCVKRKELVSWYRLFAVDNQIHAAEEFH